MVWLCSKHNINWQWYLMAKQKIKRIVPCGCLYTGTIGHHNQRQVLIPVTLMIKNILSEDVLQGTVHSLNHSITFSGVWRGSGMAHVEQDTHSWNSWTLKFLPFSDWIFSGAPYLEMTFHQLLRYGFCLLVWNIKRLFPFRKIISDDKDVLVYRIQSLVLVPWCQVQFFRRDTQGSC